MKNGRKYIRRRTSEYLSVTDRASGKMLGRILNLSPKGVLVLSAESLTVNITYALDIKLPAGVFDREHLEIAAKCRWSRFDKGSETWETGFEIEDISEDGRKLLQQVVLRLMANNGECRESDETTRHATNERVEVVQVRRYR
jgi:hypothetical protein